MKNYSKNHVLAEPFKQSDLDLDMLLRPGCLKTYRKVPKFSDARKLCCTVIYLKSKQKAQILGYFVKKMQTEY